MTAGGSGDTTIIPSGDITARWLSLPFDEGPSAGDAAHGGESVDVVWASRSDALLGDFSGTEDVMAIAVCICDDHPAFARGLARLLTDDAPDIRVTGIALSAEQAELIVRESAPDVVLMDIGLPGVSGIEAARRIRTTAPSTRVVMITANDDQADLYAALRAGASGYVTKGSDVAEIAAIVRSVVRGHLVIPAELVGSIVSDLNGPESCLTEAERAVLGGIGRGETDREIATRLGLSERTVRRRVEDIYSKLHLRDRLHAAEAAAAAPDEELRRVAGDR